MKNAILKTKLHSELRTAVWMSNGILKIQTAFRERGEAVYREIR